MGALVWPLCARNCCVRGEQQWAFWALPQTCLGPLERKVLLSFVLCVSDPLGYWTFEELQPQLWVSRSSALREFLFQGWGHRWETVKPINAVMFG